MVDKYLEYLPQCLSYLEEPYLLETDEEIIVALLSDAEREGIEGISQIYTALVPLNYLTEFLNKGGITKSSICSSGPHPCISEDQPYKAEFWINGLEGIDFEPLVVGWTSHNRTVMLPDNGFLMTYGLIPRFINSNEKIVWDDLSKPIYDVVSVKPFSKYSLPKNHSGAEVHINRKYAEDYASLKKCALVAVFYEERWFKSDQELETLLDGEDGISFELTGKFLTIIHNKNINENSYVCRVWGCRLILSPSDYPISNEKAIEFIWPGDIQVMTKERARSSMFDCIYVTDEVLTLFEKKPEFEVNSESGYVNYDAYWSLSGCRRLGRDFIAYELKIIYEGCPPYVIEHLHRFAVEEIVATKQAAELGNINIGTRANKLINAYLSFIKAIADIGNQFGLVFEDNDIGNLHREDVDYRGWQSFELLKPLGWVALSSMSETDFLERCKGIYKLFDSLKEKQIRRILKESGVNPKTTDSYRSVKLVSVLMQLVYLADNSGLNLKVNKEEICQRLVEDPRIDSVSYLFALIDLRNTDSHSISTETNPKYNQALQTFGINKVAMINGWGFALDKIYDKLTTALLELVDMSNRVIGGNQREEMS